MMNSSDAQVRCDELNATPDAEPGVRWMARQLSPGDWEVVRVVVPGLARKRPTSGRWEPRRTEPVPGPDVQPWGPVIPDGTAAEPGPPAFRQPDAPESLPWAAQAAPRSHPFAPSPAAPPFAPPQAAPPFAPPPAAPPFAPPPAAPPFAPRPGAPQSQPFAPRPGAPQSQPFAPPPAAPHARPWQAGPAVPDHSPVPSDLGQLKRSYPPLDGTPPALGQPQQPWSPAPDQPPAPGEPGGLAPWTPDSEPDPPTPPSSLKPPWLRRKRE